MNTYLYRGEVVTATSKKSILKPKKVIAQHREHLINLIEEYVELHGANIDLNFIDVSRVNDMHYLFCTSSFNGDISKWDVSNVLDMQGMFFGSKFNGDISKWDVSNVLDMHDMFFGSKFNGDISKWNVSSVKNMKNMFRNSKFNGDISKWLPVMKKNGINPKDLELPIKSDTWNDIEV